MKLILHIGTHKTGTTALQRFLHANSGPLAAHGLHYASPRSSFMGNVVADALNAGRRDTVADFLLKHAAIAKRKGAQTMVVSGENLYAPTVVLALWSKEEQRGVLDRDRAVAEDLKSVLPDSIESVRVVCYFRRPDRFVESWYNQRVKGSTFDLTFGAFLSLVRPALRYGSYASLWADVFGTESCQIRNYDAIPGDVVADFAECALGLQSLDDFAFGRARTNERLSRDLLEFKRTINGDRMESEAELERRIIGVVEDRMKPLEAEPRHYQDFLSPAARARLLSSLQSETETLTQGYGSPPFPPFDQIAAERSWRPYPGLGAERREEIGRVYDDVNRHVAFRIERRFLNSGGSFRGTVPGAGLALRALKRAGVKRAILGIVRRRQVGTAL